MAATQTPLVEVLRSNWRLETDGTKMYADLAARQTIRDRKAIFEELSAIERRHADAWARRIRELGGQVPTESGGTAHAVRVADTQAGLQEIILAIEAEERRDVASYLRQMRAIEDEPTRAILQEVVLDEFAHAHVLRRLYNQSGDRSALEFVLGRKRQGTGSWIGDAVYGVNDGLGAIFGIVSGVSGATQGASHTVLLAGLAGMIASALSMGSGAYLAAKSEAEIFEAAIKREETALREHPDAAIDEMAILYQFKGVPEQDACKIARYLAADPRQFLRTVAAEKLNSNEEALSNPAVSALSGSLSTAVGAFIPIVPFFFMNGIPAVVAAAVVSLAAHFAVGAAKSMVTVRSWWSSGLEMTAVGAAEGVVTYLLGVCLGGLG